MENKKDKFIKVRAEVQAKGIKNFVDYEAKRTKEKWPSRPEREFKNFGWNGWIDFLNCETKLAKFARIKKEVQASGVKNYSEYESQRNKYNWPARPEREFHKLGWQGWEDFLNTKLVKRKPKATQKSRIPFSLLKIKVNKLNIKSLTDYLKMAAQELDWPTNPRDYPEFTTFDDFFERHIISLEELRDEVTKHKISSRQHYTNFRRENILTKWPANPNQKIYKDWVGWNNLLNIDRPETIKKKDFLPYEVLKYFLKRNCITSYDEYRLKRKAEEGWPSNPYVHYKNTGEWKSYPDLFGKC